MKEDLSKLGLSVLETDPIRVPWFPRSHKDIDLFEQTLFQTDEYKDPSLFPEDAKYNERLLYVKNYQKPQNGIVNFLFALH